MITNEELQVEAPSQHRARIKVGAALKAARERIHLTEKEAAARLHLKPRIIVSIENEQFNNGLPAIFLRGYVRSYAKLLNFNEEQIKQLLIQLEIANPNTINTSLNGRLPHISYDNNYANWATLVIILLMTAMVGMWWKSHAQPVREPKKSVEHTTLAETQPINLPEPTI